MPREESVIHDLYCMKLCTYLSQRERVTSNSHRESSCMMGAPRDDAGRENTPRGVGVPPRGVGHKVAIMPPGARWPAHTFWCGEKILGLTVLAKIP